MISVERRDEIAIVSLNRPEKLNAISRAMLRQLTEIFKNFADEKSLRAVVLTGAGDKAFSAGTDLSELIDVPVEKARGVADGGQQLCNDVENCRVPVIAAINGIAAGAGCELALASHLRIASPNASFSLPELKLGIIPGYGGTQRLARELGHSRALEIMLTARTVHSEEALQIGLINRIAPAEGLLPAAIDLANDISALAPLAINACLQAVTKGTELPLDKGLALEADLFASLFATQDMREGTRAFLEKRKPVFKGQ